MLRKILSYRLLQLLYFVQHKFVLRLIPSYIKSDYNRYDRVGALHKAWGLVITNQMSGSYYEFGVYKGESFRDSYRVYLRYDGWMKAQSESHEMWRRKINWDLKHSFYAFDTFEGMPENDENNESFSKGTFLSSLDEVKSAGEKIGMREGDQIKYFKGNFSDIAKERSDEFSNLQPAAIVNIDSDLYSSAVDALEIITPKLQQGTVLMMDDYNCFSANRNKGERYALSEFLEKHSEIEVEKWFPYLYVGQAFIVHLN